MLNVDGLRRTMYPNEYNPSNALQLQATMAVRLAKLQIALTNAHLPVTIHNDYQHIINRLRATYGLGGALPCK